MLEGGNALRERLHGNAALFRELMQAAGFSLGGAGHPIVPVMIGDARLAADMAERLLAEGIYVVAFSYPVVPRGAARIRVQLSAAHTEPQIRAVVAAFTRVGSELGVLALASAG
jgi:glycine C-acetyltransferase